MALDGIFYRYPKFFDGSTKIYRVRNIDRWQKFLPSKISASIERFPFCPPLDWSTIAELDKEELVQLLKSAENELRRKI